jgi:hypothetical protein
MILLGTFAIWLGGRTLIVVLVVPFPIVLNIVYWTTIWGFKPILFLHTHGNHLSNSHLLGDIL